MCRVVTHPLGSGAGAAAQARALTRDRLRRWAVGQLTADATLLVSELVTNAVLHARTEVTLTLAVADGVLEVGVADGAAHLPVPRDGTDPQGRRAGPRPIRWTAEGGRGLHLLETLAESWGVAVGADGKQVWFCLAVPDDWPHRTVCPCNGENLEAVRLESGRLALAVAGEWDD